MPDPANEPETRDGADGEVDPDAPAAGVVDDDPDPPEPSEPA